MNEPLQRSATAPLECFEDADGTDSSNLTLFLESSLKGYREETMLRNNSKLHISELERVDIEAGPTEDVDVHISIFLDVLDHDSNKLIFGLPSVKTR